MSISLHAIISFPTFLSFSIFIILYLVYIANCVSYNLFNPLPPSLMFVQINSLSAVLGNPPVLSIILTAISSNFLIHFLSKFITFILYANLLLVIMFIIVIFCCVVIFLFSRNLICLLKFVSNSFIWSVQFNIIFSSIPRYLYDSPAFNFLITLPLYNRARSSFVLLLDNADFAVDMDILEWSQNSDTSLKICSISLTLFAKNCNIICKCQNWDPSFLIHFIP